MKISMVKTRDLPITVLRLPQELRLALQREAHIEGVSLNALTIKFLGQALQQQKAPPVNGRAAGEASNEPYGSQLADAERNLVAIYRRLSPEKQLALLSLLK